MLVLLRPECVRYERVPPRIVLAFIDIGRQQKSAIAKIRYTVTTSTPTNHAERPVLLTRAAVMVAISIIATAPGQNCKFIGVGPMT
jgi:hypothetical protein